MKNKMALYFTKTELGILDSAMTYYAALGWIDSESDFRNKTMIKLSRTIQTANARFGLKRKRKPMPKVVRKNMAVEHLVDIEKQGPLCGQLCGDYANMVNRLEDVTCKKCLAAAERADVRIP